MIYSRLVSTGSYLPKKILTNADLEKMVDTSDEWIVERSGISQRHIAAEGESTTMMGFEAASRALETAGLTPKDIDLIIVATTTPDKVMPGAAFSIQAKLNLPGIPAFDICAACSGFVYGMSIADQYIRSGNMKRVLVIGVETMSSVVDWTDRRTCVLFGDGAGAAIFEASEQPGIHSTHLHADGSYQDILYVPSGLPGFAKADQPPFVHMSGGEVFKVAVNTLWDVVCETLAANQMTQKDIDWLVPHQANLRIIKATAKKLGMPLEQVILTVQKHGNTSAASIPLALDEGIRDGRIKRGQRILIEAIGGGFSWGSALMTY